ncbi:MAG: type II toxin-antitoxin system RelE/ParE family toxin [Pseudomonadota bacterium]|jgi:toxin ParE1/3/4
MRVFWTPDARARLKEIEHYIAKANSPAVAREVATRIIRHVLSLEQGPPVLGKQLHQYPDHDVREIYERPYRVIFRVTPERIEILTVMHYRQLLPSDVDGDNAG